VEIQENSRAIVSIGRDRRLSSSECVGVVLAILLLAIPVVFAANKPSRFDELVIQLDDDEVTAGRKAALLKSLSQKEMERFISDSAQWIPAATGFELGRWIRSIDLLSRNKDFGPSAAKSVIEILAKQKRGFGLDGKVRSLTVRMQSKAQQLNTDFVDQEWNYLSDKKVPSSDRLAVIGALTDSMQETGIRPSVIELENLLANDVYEIRMHAVDWFRVTEFSLKDQIRFLKVAIKAQPYQVRERVFRYLSNLEDKDFVPIFQQVAGSKNGVSCVLDKSEVTRKLCEKSESRFNMLGKKEGP
jgi:hypothetical protein